MRLSIRSHFHISLHRLVKILFLSYAKKPENIYKYQKRKYKKNKAFTLKGKNVTLTPQRIASKCHQSHYDPTSSSKWCPN